MRYRRDFWVHNAFAPQARFLGCFRTLGVVLGTIVAGQAAGFFLAVPTFCGPFQVLGGLWLLTAIILYHVLHEHGVT